MPSTTQSSTNPGSTEGWGTGERYAADEEAEARLLGRYRCAKFAHSVLLVFMER